MNPVTLKAIAKEFLYCNNKYLTSNDMDIQRMGACNILQLWEDIMNNTQNVQDVDADTIFQLCEVIKNALDVIREQNWEEYVSADALKTADLYVYWANL